MATLVENAIRIKQTFDDIYDAIIEKGVTPSGGVDTYPDAIDAIDTSEGRPLTNILYCNADSAYTSKTSATSIICSYTATKDTELFIITNCYYSNRYGGTYTGTVTINNQAITSINSDMIYRQSYMYWRVNYYSVKVSMGDVIRYTATISKITGSYTSSWNAGIEIIGER